MITRKTKTRVSQEGAIAMNVADQIIHTTVRMECVTSANERAYGTGFFCHLCEQDGGGVPLIVTNKHVVKDAALGIFHMTTATDEGRPEYGQHVMVPVDDFQNMCVSHPDPDVDLAVFLLAPVLRWLESRGQKPYYRAITRDDWADVGFLNELNAVEDILMVGYPNGLWDTRNNLPIVRRGITATPPYIDFEDKPEFMIDCACFPGSSGSPIYLVNEAYTSKSGGITIGRRFKLLGVLWGGPQHTAEGGNSDRADSDRQPTCRIFTNSSQFRLLHQSQRVDGVRNPLRKGARC